MTKLIPHTINASVINQRAEDGFINATAMCQSAGKRWHDYFTLDTTTSFLDVLSLETRITVSKLICVIRGRVERQPLCPVASTTLAAFDAAVI